jgi:hypothetical protein
MLATGNVNWLTSHLQKDRREGGLRIRELILFRLQRRYRAPAPPRAHEAEPAKPRIIMVQVEGSGAAAASVTVVKK